MTPKIAIIGAGPCGLTTAKNCLELGLNNLVIFEQSNALGGNWVFDETGTHSSIYHTTHLISSKKLSAFEDFPMPADYPDYPSHQQLLAYFQDYAAHFNIKSHIKFQTVVTKALMTSDNQWQLHYQNDIGEQIEIFDYLFVANGHHWDPHLPQHAGHFKGQILHSHAYKNASPFKNKRVLVVGAGNSACDIAVEVSRVAEKTSISIRNGQHIFPKFIFGKPTDIAFQYMKWLPFRWKQYLAKFVIRMLQGRYAKYGLTNPNTLPLEKHPTINSELLYYIRHGKIHPRVEIQTLNNDRITFHDGTVDTFDTIIYATGYRTSFPFFEENQFHAEIKKPLYRKMMHPTLNSLYFIGLFQPQGCIWPLADYQAKIAASIIAGKLNRPSALMDKINAEMKQAKRQFLQEKYCYLEVDYSVFRRQLLNELRYLSKGKLKQKTSFTIS